MKNVCKQVLFCILLLACVSPLWAQGPVVLMGIDAEDGGPGGHGPINVYVSVVNSILDSVSSGSDILVIGGNKDTTDSVTRFWNAIDAMVTGQNVVFVNGASNITAQSFVGFAVIAVVSDVNNTFSGGLTNSENNALTARAPDIAMHVNGGGGLLGFTSQLNTPYGYLGEIGAFTFNFPPQFNNITPTPEGLAIGITNALDVCCWHDEYLQFPAFLAVLATNPGTGNPCAIGGSGVVLPPPDIMLDPLTSTNPIGTSHTVTATVRQEGDPLAGVMVTFAVIAGPDIGVSGMGTTDSNGKTTFTYTNNGVAGKDQIRAFFVDADGDTIPSNTVEKVWTPDLEDFSCEIEIISPPKGSLVCDDSVKVVAVTSVQGGTPPITRDCNINGFPVTTIGDTLCATIPVSIGLNVIQATCTFTDSLGNETTCSDQGLVNRPSPPTCVTNITSPQDGITTSQLTHTVEGITTITNGVTPFNIACEVSHNNSPVPTVVSADSFKADVTLVTGANLLTVFCTVTDSCGNQAVCLDTITVLHRQPVMCELEITSPDDGAIICEDSVKVTAVINLMAGLPPFDITGDVNGVPAVVSIDPVTSDTTLMATVPLGSGDNTLTATAIVVDSLGNIDTCDVAITVFLDDIPPTCTFTAQGTTVTGTIIDEHSGIVAIDTLKLRNATAIFDPFVPGANIVNFELEVIDPNKSLFFNFLVTDSCGNTFECDPVFFNLAADNTNRHVEFTFPKIDRYFHLRNEGLTEVRGLLNDKEFALTTNPAAADVGNNSFLMPLEGSIIIDLFAFLDDGLNNMSLTYTGGPGASANLLLVDVVDNVDFALETPSSVGVPQPLPTEFALRQNYPNPFNPSTRIEFDLPSGLTSEIQVRLRIYNLLGEFIREVIAEPMSPGRHVVEWDGRDQTSEVVSSGIYIYRLTAGQFKATKRMILLK